jgi:hypothetical protein
MANKHTREILLTSFIICPIPDLWPAGIQARNNDQRQSFTNLIILPTIQLIAESSFEVCISRGLTFLGPLSISVPGTSQLNQGYPMPTMHRPINNDMVRSLCLHHDVRWDQPATRGLQSIQVTVQLNHTLAHKGRLQATCDVIQDGIMPPGQPL